MVCVRCGVDRPAGRFEPRRRTCRDCVNAVARAKGRRTYTSDRQRWWEYRMTRADFLEVLELQGGTCAICKQVPTTFVVDHDHRSGAIRGLLCGPCNRALGHLRDQPGLCLAAAEYLGGST